MKKVLFILLLMLVWAAIFVSAMPLQFALDKIELPDNVQLSHLRGSVWSGGAHIVYKQQNMVVLPRTIPVDFAWHWCPGWKNGLLVVCMKADNPDFSINGSASYSPWQNRLLIQNTDLDLALAWLDLSVPIMGKPVKPQAQAHLNIETLSIDPSSGIDHGTISGVLQELELGFITLGDY